MAPARDAEPGKILHEARGGEMAALGEVPFGRYYGSVDATPLFVILAAAHHRRTGDLAFLQSIAPHVQRALDWIERYGDADGDGFVEYARQTPTGLVQQGWKDSHDSVFHEDGTLAERADRARRGAGVRLRRLAGGRRDRDRAGGGSGDALAEAESYRARRRRCGRASRRAFWDEELGATCWRSTGRSALAGCVSSNAGHALWTGIVADRARARRVADGLMSDESFSGWGIRTIAVVAGPLQPDGVSQRLGVAARQRDHRRRVRALRVPRSGGPACSTG